jgi:hypothetical protein
VTAEPPVDERTTVSVAGISATTSPKFTLVVLRLNRAEPEFSCSARVCAELPALAVSVAVSAEFAGETLAIKFALVAPAATVTEPGTVTSELLLESATTKPPVAAAAFSVAVQLSESEPVIETLAQVSPLNTGTPVPLTPITAAPPPEELLVKATCPLAAPAAGGSNCTLNVVVWPGPSVMGRPSPVIAKPVPVTAAALTVTGMVPVEERTSGSVAAEFTATLPKARLGALTAKTEVAAFS